MVTGRNGREDRNARRYSREELEETRVFRDPDWENQINSGMTFDTEEEYMDYGDSDGYYDSYGDYDGYYDDGYYEDEGYYDRNPPVGKPSMAARAAGKNNTEIYGRRPTGNGGGQTQRQYSYAAEGGAPYGGRRPVRRKKRHGFRNFILFLLVLCGLGAGAYFALFRAPTQYEDGYHTRKKAVYNILMCATDLEEARTDTIMMLTLDTENKTTTLTSLPRDILVYYDDYVQKLNAVYSAGGTGDSGARALMEAISSIVGFQPDGYVVINYDVFRDAVDAMGGVTFDVPMDMEVGGAKEGEETSYLSAGEQVLNGADALALCRYRYGYAMADIQREYVQQTFIKAMVKQCLAPEKWIRLPGVYKAVMANTLTDMSGANLRYIALKVLLSDLDQIQQNTLPGEGVEYIGQSCYGLYGQSVVDMVNDSLNPFAEPITIDEVEPLSVYEGELVKSTWRGIAFDAGAYEYQ